VEGRIPSAPPFLFLGPNMRERNEYMNNRTQSQSPPNSYRTKSVEEVAFLRAAGYKLNSEPIGEGRFKWASFEDSLELRQNVRDFYNGSPEKRLFDELRNAKQYLMD